MRQIKYVLLISTLLTMCSGVALGKAWRGIEPLHSTRADVEKMLGPSSYGGGYAYELENERVFFSYQTPESVCGKQWGFWNVPLNTVLNVTVYPREKTPFEKLGLDRTYVKGLTCMPGHFNYFNEDEGISYSVAKGLLEQISYTAAYKDKHLRCPSE